MKLIYSGFPENERHAMVEQICDYFAGCLLMPRPWVKRVYCSGVQDLPELAQTFGCLASGHGSPPQPDRTDRSDSSLPAGSYRLDAVGH